jgi:hypothetical protein
LARAATRIAVWVWAIAFSVIGFDHRRHVSQGTSNDPREVGINRAS